MNTLKSQLINIRPLLAAAAQQVYDQWEQINGYDEDLGGGGICQDIAQAIVDVLIQELPDTECGTVSASCGEQHVWAIVHMNDEAYEIDIDYSLYEYGGGYLWTKIDGVIFKDNDIIISSIHVDDARAALDYE